MKSLIISSLPAKEKKQSAHPHPVPIILESLTVGIGLGAALRDVGAEHRAHSGVRSEAPREFSAIWIPTVVFSQVPGNTKSRPAIS